MGDDAAFLAAHRAQSGDRLGGVVIAIAPIAAQAQAHPQQRPPFFRARPGAEFVGQGSVNLRPTQMLRLRGGKR